MNATIPAVILTVAMSGPVRWKELRRWLKRLTERCEIAPLILDRHSRPGNRFRPAYVPREPWMPYDSGTHHELSVCLPVSSTVRAYNVEITLKANIREPLDGTDVRVYVDAIKPGKGWSMDARIMQNTGTGNRQAASATFKRAERERKAPFIDAENALLNRVDVSEAIPINGLSDTDTIEAIQQRREATAKALLSKRDCKRAGDMLGYSPEDVAELSIDASKGERQRLKRIHSPTIPSKTRDMKTRIEYREAGQRIDDAKANDRVFGFHMERD